MPKTPKTKPRSIRLKKTKIKEVTLTVGGETQTQKGLFADEDIDVDDFVARMNPEKIRILSRRAYKARLKENPKLDKDFAIEVQGNKYATDWNVRVPKWYRMNHSATSPNVEYEWVGKKKDGYIAWRAIKRIRKNAEIRFDYGDAPAEWG
jgi:SET domain-containing protein